MSFSELALGFASLVIGINHLSNGAKRLSQKRGELADAPTSTRLVHSTGRKVVRAPNGKNVSMRMRSYEIRNLDDRIMHLRKLVEEGKRDPQVYAFTRRAVTRRCGNDWCIPEKDNFQEAKALFSALRREAPPAKTAQDIAAARSLFGNIRKNVRYTSDIAGVDTYQKPGHTLSLKAADCDDFSTLTCAALGALGIPCRFKVIRTKGANDWNHIYAQAGFPRQAPTKWVSMDASVNMPFGWEAPPSMVAASRVFRVG
jgi:transglutaminase-like putative cysteine protease